MSPKDLQDAFAAFDRLNALVIGDVMVDAYLWGNIDRVSPEAPVPVVDVTRKENRLGGAANVALNLQALGATPFLCSVIGSDDHGLEFLQLLSDASNLPTDGIVRSSDRPTTVKTRVIASSQHVLRVDEEVKHDISDADRHNLLDRIESIVTSTDIHVIVFEDYDKGVITPELIDAVVKLANKKGIPVSVDPKWRNFSNYNGVTLFKPNLKELREGLNQALEPTDLKALQAAAGTYISEHNVEMALVTLSEHGVFIHSEMWSGVVPAHIRNIADVSGAGDTVISVASLALALNLHPQWIATLANLAGGLVCEEVGVVPLNKAALLEESLRLVNTVGQRT